MYRCQIKQYRYFRQCHCVTIDESDVLSFISRLKNTLSAGPDNFPPLLFKNLKHCLSKPLAVLFNQLLFVGNVPYDWLRAIIVSCI